MTIQTNRFDKKVDIEYTLFNKELAELDRHKKALEQTQKEHLQSVAIGVAFSLFTIFFIYLPLLV